MPLQERIYFPKELKNLLQLQLHDLMVSEEKM